ncbi:MAG TPA: hypothetical protein VH105_25675 [Burkholderiales bacterium]|nr:hypothetical protein [Burkholderiales bacterium]
MTVVPLRPRAVPEGEAAPAWFAVLGIALTRVEQDDLTAYAGGLQLPAQTPVMLVEDWKTASTLTRASGGDMSWWDREEAERKRLTAQIGDAGAVMHELTRATDEIAEAVHGAAAVAAARQACGDPYIIRVAAGAAMQATHLRALAHMAGEPAHFFERKYQLFAAGHWPLGVYGGAFHIF